MFPRSQLWRSRLALLALAAFAFTATAAALVSHGHDGPSSATSPCQLCHAVHLPALETVAMISAAPSQFLVGPVASLCVPSVAESLAQSHLGRSPPA